MHPRALLAKATANFPNVTLQKKIPRRQFSSKKLERRRRRRKEIFRCTAPPQQRRGRDCKSCRRYLHSGEEEGDENPKDLHKFSFIYIFPLFLFREGALSIYIFLVLWEKHLTLSSRMSGWHEWSKTGPSSRKQYHYLCFPLLLFGKNRAPCVALSSHLLVPLPR